MVGQLHLPEYLVERAVKDGWGFFGQVSFADQATSPITTFFDIGLGGNGLIPSRRRDEFGIAYAYTDLSDELKDNLDLLALGGRLRVEHQVELFYNLQLTPWFQLTGDLSEQHVDLWHAAPLADLNHEAHEGHEDLRLIGTSCSSCASWFNNGALGR